MDRFVAILACGWLSAGGAAAVAPATGPGAGPDINPPQLFLPLPDDRSTVDTEATVVRRLKAEPSSLNPLLMYTGIDAEFDYLIWDRPFLLDARLEWRLNPAVAESYEESADHTQATLRLRPRLTWHDGQPFTAEDIVFSWVRLTDDRVAARKAAQGARQVTACTAADAVTVRYTFAAPLPTNRWNVDFPIVPQHVYAAGLDADRTLERSDEHVRHNRNPVGNGPYRFVSWETEQRLVLERWDAYSGPKPALRRIVFRIVPDNNAALLAFEAGQLDETELTPQQFALETGGERFAAVGVKARGEQWTTYYIGWNTGDSNSFFADARVRQAMCHALNRSLINERVFFGLFQASHGLFPAGSWVGAPEVEEYRYDLRRAAELLDQAGWRLDEADGWRYRDNGVGDAGKPRTRFSFTLNIVQGSQTSPKVADIMAEDLKRLGVAMNTQVLEWSVFNDRNFKHEFEAYLSAWTPGPEPDEAWNLFHSSARSGGRNYVGYANAAVDELFEQARRSFSPETRRECYRRIGVLVCQDAPYTFLVNAPTLWAFNRDVRGVQQSPRGPACFYPGALAWWKPRPPQ